MSKKKKRVENHDSNLEIHGCGDEHPLVVQWVLKLMSQDLINVIKINAAIIFL